MCPGYGYKEPKKTGQHRQQAGGVMSKKAKPTFLDYCFRISGFWSLLSIPMLFFVATLGESYLNALAITFVVSVIIFIVSTICMPFIKGSIVNPLFKAFAIVTSLCLVAFYITSRLLGDECSAGVAVMQKIDAKESNSQLQNTNESTHETSTPTIKPVRTPTEPKFDSKKPLLSSGKVEGVTCNIYGWFFGGLGKAIFSIILLITAILGIKVSLNKWREKKQGNSENPPGEL